MFLRLEQIRNALAQLRAVSPFFVLTFPVGKQVGLPVGGTTHVAMDKAETGFLDKHYRPKQDSQWYYAPWDTGRKDKWWVRHDYGSSGSQKARTTTFRDAFIHRLGTDEWGWSSNYVDVLRTLLRTRGALVPAFALAVWLYRDKDWAPDTSPEDVMARFYREFRITPEEREALFGDSIPPGAGEGLLQDAKVTWRELRGLTGLPPDAPPEEGGALAYLELRGVGPAERLKLDLGERLNLITGDNGLGKTFLLDCAWWALTGHWPALQAYPRSEDTKRVGIWYRISGESAQQERASYDRVLQGWQRPKGRGPVPGLLVYARVDGSFAVWDPARDYWPHVAAGRPAGRGLTMSGEQVWEGVTGSDPAQRPEVLSNGLIRDWVTWQSQPDQHPFGAFVAVLKHLSPPSGSDIGVLQPGEPRRVGPRDARLIPTLKHPYGEVPVLYESAGIRRIVAIAYLIVWAWHEHKVHASMIRKPPQRDMVVLVDEMEAHLHPQWQRAILPALLSVTSVLSPEMRTQFLVATHSPLVMASVEPSFDSSQDKLFHLDVVPGGDRGADVVLEGVPFAPRGEVDQWLRSPIFELRQARSLEAEAAIEDAKALQVRDDVTQEEVEALSQRLLRLLSGDDLFWPRWLSFAEKHGVPL
jgi:hypothetical protein